MSATSNTWQEVAFSNTSSTEYTAFNTSNSEGSCLTGGVQPVILAGFFNSARRGQRAVFRAAGVLGDTGTPTLTMRVRLGTTAGASFLTGSLCAATAALTLASGVTNQHWELQVEMLCQTPGAGSGAMTLACRGRFKVFYSATPTANLEAGMGPDGMSTPATWTQTLDGYSNQYVNLTAQWSVNSLSNTITCKEAVFEGLN